MAEVSQNLGLPVRRKILEGEGLKVVEIRSDTLKGAPILTGPTAPARRSHVRLWLYFLLFILDIVAVAFAFELGTLARYGKFAWQAPMDIVVITLPIYIVTAFNNGSYSIDVLRESRAGVLRSTVALLFAFSCFLFISYYLRLLQFESRLAVSVGIIGSLVFIVLFRVLAGKLIKKVTVNRITADILILDDVEMVFPPYCNIVNAKDANISPNIRDPMMLDRLARLLRGADRVVIACKREKEREWSMLLKGVGIHGEIISNEFDEVGA
ncbi:MAG: hypothetical protein EOO61_18660, partial [Hymenobacter sp.]